MKTFSGSCAHREDGKKSHSKAYYQVHFVSHMWDLYRKGSDIKEIDWPKVDFYKTIVFSVSYKIAGQEKNLDHKVTHLVGLSLFCWVKRSSLIKRGDRRRESWDYEKGLGKLAFLKHLLCFRWFNIWDDLMYVKFSLLTTLKLYLFQMWQAVYIMPH